MAARKNGDQRPQPFKQREDRLVLETFYEYEFCETSFHRIALLLARAVHRASLWCREPVHRLTHGGGPPTIRARVATTGGADCVVPGCPGCSDSCGGDVSDPDR